MKIRMISRSGVYPEYETEGSAGMDVRAWIDNTDMITGELDGEVLKIEASPFAYGRCNRPELLQIFSDTAAALRGKPTRATLSPIKPRQRQTRSLDELRRFGEVRFINE